MLHLRRGDSLPIVVAVQSLLNAYRGSAEPLKVDGLFGPKTQLAILAFQKARQLPLSQRVDERTWCALNAELDLRVHDHVDIFDPVLRQSARVLEDAGARPSLAGGTCNGVAALLGELTSSGVGSGQLLLLRLHGHGNKGVQALSYGTMVHTYYDALLAQPVPDLHHLPAFDTLDPRMRAAAQRTVLYSQISLESMALPGVLHELALLAPLFHTHGSVEFHGCQVGGREVGRSMLRAFADRVGVPAVGARTRQLTSNAVRYHGALEIQCPAGLSLPQWARRLPSIEAAMSCSEPAHAGAQHA